MILISKDISLIIYSFCINNKALSFKYNKKALSFKYNKKEF